MPLMQSRGVVILVCVFGFSGNVCAPANDMCRKFTPLRLSINCPRLSANAEEPVGGAENSGDAWLVKRCGNPTPDVPPAGQMHAAAPGPPDARPVSVPPAVWGLRFEWQGRVHRQQVLRQQLI